MDENDVSKLGKKPFCVPVVQMQVEEKEKKSETNDDGMSDKEIVIKSPVKKKQKKFRPVGFKAPTATTTDSIVNQSNKDGQTDRKENKKSKGEKKKDATKSDEKPIKRKKELTEKSDSKEQHEENLVPKKKVTKSTEPSKPVKHLTDEEYEVLFNSALERIMNQSIDPMPVKPETSTIIEETCNPTSDIKTEGAVEDNFESLSHVSDVENITNGEGDAKEDEDSRGLEAPDEADQLDNGKIAELLQLTNEITPSVSDDEVKPVIAPVKQKKTAPPKKKMSPVQLDLGVEEKKQCLSSKVNVKPQFGKNKHPKKKEMPVKVKTEDEKPKPKMKKVSKKKEMLNREIEPAGTWVQCVNVNCLKWRHLKDTHDPSVLPERWTCEMNPDIMYNSCDLPEEDYDENCHQETFIYTHFSEGSVVWTKMVGYPWWPAMIEIDPDTQEYFEVDLVDPMVPTHYHVVFFDQKVSRAWIRTLNVRNFTGADLDFNLMSMSKGLTHRKEVETAKENAKEALSYPLKERVKKFSFSARFKGTWARASKEEQEGSEMTEENFWKGMKHLSKCGRRKRKSSDKSLAESDAQSDMGFELDDGTLNEIIDKAESILNSAEDLCSLGESFPDCEDEPDFEPTLSKISAPDKFSEQTESETYVAVQPKKEKIKIMVKEEKFTETESKSDKTSESEPVPVHFKKKKSNIVVKEEEQSDLDQLPEVNESTNDISSHDDQALDNLKKKAKKCKTDKGSNLNPNFDNKTTEMDQPCDTKKQKKKKSKTAIQEESEPQKISTLESPNTSDEINKPSEISGAQNESESAPEKIKKKAKKSKRAEKSNPTDSVTVEKETTELEKTCETKKPKKKKFKTVIKEESKREKISTLESPNTSDEINKPSEISGAQNESESVEKETTELEKTCENKKPKKKKFKTVIREENKSKKATLESPNSSGETGKPSGESEAQHEIASVVEKVIMKKKTQGNLERNEKEATPDSFQTETTSIKDSEVTENDGMDEKKSASPKSRKLKKFTLAKVDKKDKNTGEKTEMEPKKKKSKFEVVAANEDLAQERLSHTDAQYVDDSQQHSDTEQSHDVKPLSLKRKADKSAGSQETSKKMKKKTLLRPLFNPGPESNGDGDFNNLESTDIDAKNEPEAGFSESESESELDFSTVLGSNDKKQEKKEKSVSIKQQKVTKTTVEKKEEYSSDEFECEVELDLSTVIPNQSLTKSVNAENSDPFEALEE